MPDRSLHDKLRREHELHFLRGDETSVSDLYAMVLDMFSAIIHVVEPPGGERVANSVAGGVAVTHEAWAEMMWLLSSAQQVKHRLSPEWADRVDVLLEKLGVD